MLRFVDQEDDNQPTQIASLYRPGFSAPNTSEQSNPYRIKYQQNKLQNRPSINLQKDVDHSQPQLQRIRQIIDDSENLNPFEKQNLYDEFTEESLA